MLKVLDCPIIWQEAEGRTPTHLNEAVTFLVEKQAGDEPSPACPDFLGSIEAFQENDAVRMICCCAQYPLETNTVR